MPRAVIDTSALVPQSWRIELQRAATAGLFVGVWSPWIIAETWRVLAWRWAKRAGTSTAEWRAMSSSANEMFALLDEVYRLVHPTRPFPKAWPTLSDPNDRPIFAAAKVSGAEVVVSLNTKDYPPGGSYQGVRYLSPEDFLRWVCTNLRTPCEIARAN